MEEQFFNDLKGDGELHSSGAFSISPRQALKKLGAFTLSEPDAWTLFAVQAAVLAGSEDCVFTNQGNRVDVRFSSCSPFSLKDVVEALEYAQIRDSVGGLLTNLARIGMVREWSMTMSLKVDDRSLEVLKLSPDELSLEELSPLESNRFEVSIEIDRSPLNVQEMDLLSERVRFAPLSVVIGRTAVAKMDRDSQRTFAYEEEGSKTPAASIEWLRNGCVIAVETLATLKHSGYHAVADAQDLPTDLTGFAPMKNAQSRTLRFEALDKLIALAKTNRGLCKLQAERESKDMELPIIMPSWLAVALYVGTVYLCLRMVWDNGIRTVLDSTFLENIGLIFIFLLSVIPAVAFLTATVIAPFGGLNSLYALWSKWGSSRARRLHDSEKTLRIAKERRAQLDPLPISLG